MKRSLTACRPSKRDPSEKMNYIDLAQHNLVIEPRYYCYGWSRSKKIVARPSLARALMRAKKFLPAGYTFKIWDCRRPRSVQLLMLASFRRRLKIMHPGLSSAELAKIVRRFGARPLKRVTRPDTHRNGGAVDLTIIDRSGRELYMGTDHDDLTDRAATDYFESKKKLSTLGREARKNRRLLKRVLTRAGLKNYAAEWWHWYYPHHR
ncbi:MAG: hypothetical protein A3B31_02930 [Candidatus Komeilibacteria bacterium RIFCSPLOWO2_01_FULL_53_11]|uniref:D-Ala-D-Ala dipeptidase n=1 Tax=Candidatus Komeilibacteria bacterium RIFCSPLOWO2_01_FULL_53_11 TaxID=1798552 RepID=A0A1G2BV49_9BACT|nr:MAG: hypothetical protein A3B31_02930 [Candidatus Komeilibacteria bacterium RIFCSPLOWO2_01_FULL_53_11]